MEVNFSHYNFTCWKLGHSKILRPRGMERTNILLVWKEDSVRSQLEGIAKNKMNGIAGNKMDGIPISKT